MSVYMVFQATSLDKTIYLEVVLNGKKSNNGSLDAPSTTSFLVTSNITFKDLVLVVSPIDCIF